MFTFIVKAALFETSKMQQYGSTFTFSSFCTALHTVHIFPWQPEVAIVAPKKKIKICLTEALIQISQIKLIMLYLLKLQTNRLDHRLFRSVC